MVKIPKRPKEPKTPTQQARSSLADHLKPWQFQPGQSGNPKGKLKGTVSLKKFAQKYIQELSDEEKMEFLTGIDKKTVWEMAEDKPKQGNEITGSLSISDVLDNLSDGSKISGQNVEDK